MSIQEIEQEIIEEFSNFEDWMDKYSYIIEIGNSCPIIEEKEKTENNLIKGCQSRVWVSAKLDENGLMQITADSDAVITKGIITLLLRVFNNQTYFIKSFLYNLHKSAFGRGFQRRKCLLTLFSSAQFDDA
jgi:cysteine desulfuration protein SufE